MNSFTNVTFDEIEVGRSETVTRRLSQTEVEALALVSGDIDNFHLEKAAGSGGDGSASARAVGAEALVTGVLCRRLPGPGTTVMRQALEFNGTIRTGDELTATVTALEKEIEGNVVVFDCRVTRGDETIVSGTATVHEGHLVPWRQSDGGLDGGVAAANHHDLLVLVLAGIQQGR